MSDDKNRRICLGIITGAQGIRGEVKIKPYTETPENVAAYGPLENKDGSRSFEILRWRVAKGLLIAKLKDFGDRNSAETLKGVELYIDQDRLPPEDEDDIWYYSDLIGLDVYLTNGKLFGEVISVQNFGAGDLLDIRDSDTRKSVFVPFTSQHVPEVNITDGRVTIDPPDGLLENEE